MSTSSRQRRWSGGVLVAATLIALATGCGDDSTPAESVPALSRQLDRVDAAIAGERYDDARTALDDLTATAERAGSDGTIGEADADAILRAAAALADRLPDASESPEPSSTPSPSSVASQSPPVEPDDEEDVPKEHGKGKGQGQGKAHGHDKD